MLELYSQTWLEETFWSPQNSSLKSKVPYFKNLTKITYRVTPNEESRENGYIFGINTFINKKY